MAACVSPSPCMSPGGNPATASKLAVGKLRHEMDELRAAIREVRSALIGSCPLTDIAVASVAHPAIAPVAAVPSVAAAPPVASAPLATAPAAPVPSLDFSAARRGSTGWACLETQQRMSTGWAALDADPALAAGFCKSMALQPKESRVCEDVIEPSVVSSSPPVESGRALPNIDNFELHVKAKAAQLMKELMDGPVAACVASHGASPLHSPSSVNLGSELPCATSLTAAPIGVPTMPATMMSIQRAETGIADDGYNCTTGSVTFPGGGWSRPTVGHAPMPNCQVVDRCPAHAAPVTSIEEFRDLVEENPLTAPELEQRLREIFEQCVGKSQPGSNAWKLNKRKLVKLCRSDKNIADFFKLPQQIRQEDGSRDAMERQFQAIDTKNDREVDWTDFKSFYTRRSSVLERIQCFDDGFNQRRRVSWAGTAAPSDVTTISPSTLLDECSTRVDESGMSLDRLQDVPSPMAPRNLMRAVSQPQLARCASAPLPLLAAADAVGASPGRRQQSLASFAGLPAAATVVPARCSSPGPVVSACVTRCASPAPRSVETRASRNAYTLPAGPVDAPAAVAVSTSPVPLRAQSPWRPASPDPLTAPLSFMEHMMPAAVAHPSPYALDAPVPVAMAPYYQHPMAFCPVMLSPPNQPFAAMPMLASAPHMFSPGAEPIAEQPRPLGRSASASLLGSKYMMVPEPRQSFGVAPPRLLPPGSDAAPRLSRADSAPTLPQWRVRSLSPVPSTDSLHRAAEPWLSPMGLKSRVLTPAPVDVGAAVSSRPRVLAAPEREASSVDAAMVVPLPAFVKRGSITDSLFDTIDADQDGIITRQEFRAALKRQVVIQGNDFAGLSDSNPAQTRPIAAPAVAAPAPAPAKLAAVEERPRARTMEAPTNGRSREELVQSVSWRHTARASSPPTLRALAEAQRFA